jgi:hypothetical protein
LYLTAPNSYQVFLQRELLFLLLTSEKQTKRQEVLSNLTITSWARSYREQSNYYTMGKILQGSNLTITQWARSPRGAI